MRHFTYLGAISALASVTAAKFPSAQQWAERSIYQVMTDRFARPAGSSDEPCDPYKYCGGSWTGIIDRLDYIQDLGFTAVQISPVVENIPEHTTYGEAYHGYWPQDLYALNEHFGTADDLRKLSAELHKREMYLMVDVVINDMAQAVNGSTTSNGEPDIDWSRLIPFNDEKYYHPFCSITDWNNPDMAKNCWFSADTVALPDLNTEDATVVSMIQEWAKGLVGNYSIDGLRIDATKHMNDAYLTSFSEAAGVFTIGEVYTENTDAVCRYQEFVSGLLNYPMYSPMIQAFTAGNMPGLAESVRAVRSQCKDFTRLASFTENHDTPRFASLINDTTLAKNAMAFNILSDGIPIVYQGQEQHLRGPSSPYNRSPLWPTNYTTTSPLYNTTATLNRLRNHAIRLDSTYITTHSEELYLDGSTYATRKGAEGKQIVSVFSNQGAGGGPYNLTIPGAFKPGTEVVEVLSCKKVTADKEGRITVEMDEGEPMIFFPAKRMAGSGICGSKERKGPAALCASADGKGKNETAVGKNHTEKETAFEHSSSGSGVSMSLSMVLLGVLAGVACWVL
ncbi:glycoside hydrolase superfamily [Aspergillus pseudodeflectus]|uniref:alpha-amylase n=1 Tax=Aspergillus pseudodeflectus TaxID=176178 RepID=A0ABR4KHL7_9EURO